MVAVYRCNARFRAGINQSDAEIAIDNAFSFFVSGSWSRSDKNMVLDVGKKANSIVVDSISCAP